MFVKSQRNHLDCRWQGEMKHWVVCEPHGRNLCLSPFRCSQCRFSPLYQTQSHLPLLHHRFYHHLARYQLEWTEIKLTVMTDWGTKVYMDENLMPSMFILYPEVNKGCVQWTLYFQWYAFTNDTIKWKQKVQKNSSTSITGNTILIIRDFALSSQKKRNQILKENHRPHHSPEQQWFL